MCLCCKESYIVMYLYLICSLILVGIAIYLFHRGNHYINDSYYQQYEIYHNHYLSKDGKEILYNPIYIRRFYYTYFFYNYISCLLIAFGLFFLGTFTSFFSNDFCNVITVLFTGLAEGFFPVLNLLSIIMHKPTILFTVVYLKIISIIGLVLGLGLLVFFISWLIKILIFWYDNKQKNFYLNNCDLDQKADNDIRLYKTKKEILLSEFNEKCKDLNYKLEIYQQKLERGKDPKKLLKDLKLYQKKEKESRSGVNKFINVVTGGAVDKTEAKEEYMRVKKVWDAYKIPLMINQTQAELLKIEYKYYWELALQLAERIKNILENTRIKNRDFNDSRLDISELKFTGLSLSDIQNLESMSNNKKLAFANKIVNTFFDYKNKTLRKQDVASLAFFAVDTWITNANNNAMATEKYIKKTSTMIENFKTLENECINIDIIVVREREIITSLKKSIDTFEKTFFNVSEELFPHDDVNKSRENRKNNVVNGGLYFNAEEKIKLQQLSIILKYLLRVVDTEI